LVAMASPVEAMTPTQGNTQHNTRTIKCLNNTKTYITTSSQL
jgi:hypothetical protein